MSDIQGSDEMFAAIAKAWAEPFRESILEECDGEWRSAIKSALDDERVFRTMARGMSSGGFPVTDNGLLSWSDWLTSQVEAFIAKARGEHS